MKQHEPGRPTGVAKAAFKPMDMDAEPLQYVSSLTDTLIAHGKETIVILGPDLDRPEGPTIHFVNAAAERLIRRPAAEVTGQPLGRISDPEMMPRIMEQLQTAASSKSPIDAEIRVLSADGRVHWIDVSTTPIFGSDGNLRHFVRIGRDVTTRKLAEQQRELTQRLLASLFGVVDDPLLVADDRGQIIMVNAALGRRLGWSMFDAIGMTLLEIIAPQGDADPLQLLRNGQENLRLEASFKHRDGKRYGGILNTTVVREPSGRPYHLFKLKIGEEHVAAQANVMQIVRDAGGSIPNTKSVVAGKLQLIGLDAVRQRLGDRWPALAERTFAMAERVIQKHLMQGDVLRRSSDDGFLVLFSGLTEAEAQFKSLTIGAEIREQLIGELPEASEAKVASFAAAVTIEEAESKTEESIVEALGRRLEDERSRLEDTARAEARLAFMESTAIFTRLQNGRKQSMPIMLARSPRAMREPIGALEALGQTPFSLELEIFLLSGACERILGDLSRRTGDVIIVPVRIETLSQSRDIETWLAVARTLGDAGRQRIMAEVTGVPADIAQIRMRDITMRLSTLFRSVVYELPTTDPGFIQALPGATKLATIPYRRFVDADGVPLARTSRLLKALERRSCRLIVKDVAPDQAESLLGSGVSLLEINADQTPI